MKGETIKMIKYNDLVITLWFKFLIYNTRRFKILFKNSFELNKMLKNKMIE